MAKQSNEDILRQLAVEGGKGSGKAQEQITAALAKIKEEQDAAKEENQRTKRSILTRKDVKEIFEDLYKKEEEKRDKKLRTTLQKAFKEMYDAEEKKRQAKSPEQKDQTSENINDSDFKRDQAELRFNVGNLGNIMRENNFLLRQQVTLQQQGLSLLSSIDQNLRSGRGGGFGGGGLITDLLALLAGGAAIKYGVDKLMGRDTTILPTAEGTFGKDSAMAASTPDESRGSTIKYIEDTPTLGGWDFSGDKDKKIKLYEKDLGEGSYQKDLGEYNRSKSEPGYKPQYTQKAAPAAGANIQTAPTTPGTSKPIESTAAIAEASQRGQKQKELKIDASSMIFKAKKMTFEVGTLVIDASKIKKSEIQNLLKQPGAPAAPSAPSAPSSAPSGQTQAAPSAAPAASAPSGAPSSEANNNAPQGNVASIPAPGNAPTAVGAVQPPTGRQLDQRNLDLGQPGAATPSGPGATKILSTAPGTNTLEFENGRVEQRTGSRNWRNNNPGNLEYGDFAKKYGAIGTDGRFAIFPSLEAGRKAQEALLFESKKYQGMTIAQAISRYAPPGENNTAGYINTICRSLGVAPDTPMANLTPEQRQAMMQAMHKVEGFREGKTVVLNEGRKMETPAVAGASPQQGASQQSAPQVAMNMPGVDIMGNVTGMQAPPPEAPAQGAKPPGEKPETPGGAPSGDIIAMGKWLQGQGIRISEHPAFGGVAPVHRGRGHYDGRAIDVNAPGSVVEANDPIWGPKFDGLASAARNAGYMVIWRSAGHFNHMHIESKTGGGTGAAGTEVAGAGGKFGAGSIGAAAKGMGAQPIQASLSGKEGNVLAAAKAAPPPEKKTEGGTSAEPEAAPPAEAPKKEEQGFFAKLKSLYVGSPEQQAETLKKTQEAERTGAQYDAMGNVTMPAVAMPAAEPVKKEEPTPPPVPLPPQRPKVTPKPKAAAPRAAAPVDPHVESRRLYQQAQDMERRGENSNSIYWMAEAQRKKELAGLESGKSAPAAATKKPAVAKKPPPVPLPPKRPSDEEPGFSGESGKTLQRALDASKAMEAGPEPGFSGKSGKILENNLRNADEIAAEEKRRAAEAATSRQSIDDADMARAPAERAELGRIQKQDEAMAAGVKPVDTGARLTGRNLGMMIGGGPEASREAAATQQTMKNTEGDAYLGKDAQNDQNAPPGSATPSGGDGWLGKFFPYLFGDEKKQGKSLAAGDS